LVKFWEEEGVSKKKTNGFGELLWGRNIRLSTGESIIGRGKGDVGEEIFLCGEANSGER